MKHFLYTIKKHRRDSNGNTKRTVNLWSVAKNVPTYLSYYSYYYHSDRQAVAILAYEVKAIPAKYASEYQTTVRLENEGIATFHSI